MKKTYLQPQTDVVAIELQKMVAASIVIDSTETIDPANADSREFFFDDEYDF